MENHPYVTLGEHPANFTLQTGEQSTIIMAHRWLTAVFDMTYRTTVAPWVDEGSYLWPLQTHHALAGEVFGTTLDFSFSDRFLKRLFEKEALDMSYDAFVVSIYNLLIERCVK